MSLIRSAWCLISIPRLCEFTLISTTCPKASRTSASSIKPVSSLREATMPAWMAAPRATTSLTAMELSGFLPLISCSIWPVISMWVEPPTRSTRSTWSQPKPAWRSTCCVVNRATTQVIDQDRALFARQDVVRIEVAGAPRRLERIGEGGRRRFVENIQDVEPGDTAGVLRRLAARVIKVSRHRDDGLADGAD